MFSIKEGLHEIEVSGKKLLLDFGAKLPEPDTIGESTAGSWFDPVTKETVVHPQDHADDDASKAHLRVTDAESGEAVHVVFAKRGDKLTQHKVSPKREEAPAEEPEPEPTGQRAHGHRGTLKGTNIPSRREVESQA